MDVFFKHSIVKSALPEAATLPCAGRALALERPRDERRHARDERDEHHQGAAGAERHEFDMAQRRLTLGRDDEAGEVEHGFAAPPRLLEAEYFVPYLAHAQLETTACMAICADSRLRLWAPTQAPEIA